MDDAVETSRRRWRRVPVLMLPGLLLFAGCGAAPARQAGPTHHDRAAKPASAALPADVAAFKVRRDQCDHFRGEDPGDDEARAAQLERKLEQTCKGTDAGLATLRRRYAGNATVKAALAGYEDDVE